LIGKNISAFRAAQTAPMSAMQVKEMLERRRWGGANKIRK